MSTEPAGRPNAGTRLFIRRNVFPFRGVGLQEFVVEGTPATFANDGKGTFQTVTHYAMYWLVR